MGINDVLNFDFMDPPEEQTIIIAIKVIILNLSSQSFFLIPIFFKK